MQVVNAAEESLVPIVLALRVALEAVGGFWVAIGFAYALMELITAHLKRQASSFTAIRLSSFTAIRLRFSRYLSLALEFQLASDILSTSVAPSWQEIGKLGATAVIRTALNYFLDREIHEYKERDQEERHVEHAVAAPEESRTLANA